MIFAMAAIIAVCFALATGAITFGVFTWATRENKGDMFAAIFATFCGLAFAGTGVWAFMIFRHTLLVLGGLK